MKILVIAPSWVGDMMMSHSLYRSLKQRDGDVCIEVMAPGWCRPLLARMPEVSAALEMPVGHGRLALAERYRLGCGLRAKHYQQAIVLPGSFKSALIPWFAGIPRRTGWRGEMRYGLLNDMRLLDKAALPRMVERYVALAFEWHKGRTASDVAGFAYPQLRVAAEETAALCSQFGLAGGRASIGFCPGAEFGPAKRWPHYHYASLAARLIAQGWQIVLFGSANDRATGERILQQLDQQQQAHCHNLAGQTSLDQAVVLLAGCGAVVTNDSGLMHIAAALDLPLLALYGPSSPEFTPPLSAKARVIRLISGYHKLRRGGAEQGYHQSLIDITPAMAAEQLQDLLAVSASGGQ